MSSAQHQGGESKIGFSPVVILHLANTYRLLLKVIFEMVQNAIDKNAKYIWISINQKSEVISVSDDGDGTTPEFFSKAIGEIGQTMKTNRSDLGRFGLGLISPVDKCKKYTFTSTPRGKNAYHMWTFEQEVIRKEGPTAIPFVARPDLVFGEYAGTQKGIGKVMGVQWRTQARLEHITVHRLMSEMTPENLCAGILDNYNEALKRKGVTVLVTYTDENGVRSAHEVRAKEYEGVPLPFHRITNREVGDTGFRIFLAANNGKKNRGKIVVGEDGNDFRVSLDTFSKALPAGLRLSDDVKEALTSGVFEGEILSSRCRWHPDRKCFEVNDALVGFCAAIERWYAEIGSNHYMQASEGERDEKLRESAQRMLEKLSRAIQTDYGSSFGKLLQSLTFGGVHRKTREVVEKDPDAIEPTPRPSGPRAPATPRPKGEGDEPSKKGKSGGIQLFLQPLIKNSALYEVDALKGCIIINTRHQLWQDCEDHGQRTMERYQEWLLIEAIPAISMGDDKNWHENAHMMTESKAPLMVWFFKDGDKVGRELAKADRVTARTKSVVIKKR